jgi:hypothetical protein
MKKLFLLGACLLALASAPAKAQTVGKEVVVVRMIDAAARSKMVIARPDGKTEEVEFNGGLNSSSLKDAAVTIQRVISGLSQEGYVLKSTFTGSQGYGSTLVFMKE